MKVRRVFATIALTGVCALLPVAAAGQGSGSAGQGDESAHARAAARIRALQRESDALAAQERTLLADLRKLEIDRSIRSEELAQITAELGDTRVALQDAVARAEGLSSAAAREQPLVEARLVQLYKLGPAGYWRLLLDTRDARAIGRAYRTASAMLQIDRARVEAHAQTLAALARERQELETRARAIEMLQQRAVQARTAADRAVAAHTALIASIDEQRDLNAQMTGELEAAQHRLQGTLNQLGTGATSPILPLGGFRGALPWPGEGVVVQRFGRQPGTGGAPSAMRYGIEISIAEGRPARAVHEGTVAFAGPFTGYGRLVIVEHGDGTHSLYGHLRSIGVERGDHVDAGAALGETGRNPNGNPALYFELRVDGKPVDPLQWLRKQL